MEILGIGMAELVFIIIIALIVLGPRDMQKAGRTIGKFLRNIVQSDGWKVFRQTSNEIRTLPHKLMRDANNEVTKLTGDLRGEIKNVTNSVSSLTSNTGNPQQPQASKPFGTDSPPANQTENTISNPNQQPQSSESESDKDA